MKRFFENARLYFSSRDPIDRALDYQLGRGVEKDEKKAQDLYIEALEQGELGAYEFLNNENKRKYRGEDLRKAIGICYRRLLAKDKESDKTRLEVGLRRMVLQYNNMDAVSYLARFYHSENRNAEARYYYEKTLDRPYHKYEKRFENIHFWVRAFQKDYETIIEKIRKNKKDRVKLPKKEEDKLLEKIFRLEKEISRLLELTLQFIESERVTDEKILQNVRYLIETFQDSYKIIGRDQVRLQRLFQHYIKAVKLGSQVTLDELLAKGQEYPHAYFVLAEHYENDPSEIITAYRYYGLAASLGHLSAWQHLEHLALQGDSEAQYALGFHCYHQRGEFYEAARWCVDAERSGHEKAHDYLNKTDFEASVCLMIATKYRRIDAFSEAITFYEKAVAKDENNAEIYYDWAQLYEPGDEPYLELCVEAMKRGHTLARKKIEDMASDGNDAAREALNNRPQQRSLRF